MRLPARVDMLHKANEMRGYHIVATDGAIGHVKDFLIDEHGWTLRYLVVDTSNWIGGKSVLIASTAIARVDSPGRHIHVALTRDAIKSGPSVSSAPIDPAEMVPALWII